MALQALERAQELLRAPVGRRWPASRQREAWVVYRHGTTVRDEWTRPESGPELVGEHGAWHAGGRGAGQDQRAAAAIALYEKGVEHRPAGWPTAGAGALCVLAAQRRSDTFEGDIARLLVLARDMCACSQINDDEHRRRSAGRAAKRRQAPDTPMPFRSTLPPRWETVDQRRRRLRDQLLLGGEDPADWTIATALAHRLGLKVAAEDREYAELTGARDRAARYREQLRVDLWDLPAAFSGDAWH